MKKYYIESRRTGISWIEHIMRRNCLLKHVIQGKIQGRKEMTGGQGIKHK